MFVCGSFMFNFFRITKVILTFLFLDKFQLWFWFFLEGMKNAIFERWYRTLFDVTHASLTSCGTTVAIKRFVKFESPQRPIWTLFFLRCQNRHKRWSWVEFSNWLGPLAVNGSLMSASTCGFSSRPRSDFVRGCVQIYFHFLSCTDIWFAFVCSFPETCLRTACNHNTGADSWPVDAQPPLPPQKKTNRRKKKKHCNFF